MRTLQGHPAMVKLYEVFEDSEGYHVVVEFCAGGAIFDQIVKKACCGLVFLLCTWQTAAHASWGGRDGSAEQPRQSCLVVCARLQRA